jgi:hypothetical protein
MLKKRASGDIETGVVALCGERGCCPVVDFTFPGKVILRDDLGGRVQLTREQWADLKDKFASR